MINILFICIGNTCRSPMCEYIFKYLITQKNLYHQFNVKSCGIAASYNQPANNNAINAVNHIISSYNDNNNIKNHKSTLISINLIKQANYIFALDLSILNYLKKFWIHLINGFLFCLTDEGISDPYGSSLDEYILCAKNIESALNKILIKIIKNEKL